jgi:hypothetical protein
MRKVILLIGLSVTIALSFFGAGTNATQRITSITVSAGEFTRQETVVTFDLPQSFRGKTLGLKDDSGTIPLQVDGAGRAAFILPELKAGTTRTYRVVNLKSIPAAEMVKAERDGSKLNIKSGDLAVLSYQGLPGPLPSPDIKPIFVRGGYIHPVFTPGGHLVTDDYPNDHYHHHGIWFAWTKTEFEGRHPDFWNMGTGSARVQFEALDEFWSGPVDAGFKSRQRYMDLSGPTIRSALNEQWDVHVYRAGQGTKKYFIFDIVATQECASNSPLILDDYRYDGMGVRGHRNWKDKAKVSFLTSEGKHRDDGNATRARWCFMGGPVDGTSIGIAVLDHPSNFRSPQPLRINPDDPYFNFAPSQMGQFGIKPGERFVLRYRYIVSDGEPDVAELNRMWNDYAHPVEVMLR